ncbi:MAG TPA: hypothetical protein VKV15_23305 [Bryobacteraceae bacterium]|nr:hypothetical protein [Bryobacteraceae bacterium]
MNRRLSGSWSPGQHAVAGRKQLAAEHARWEQLVAAIASVMQERQTEG